MSKKLLGIITIFSLFLACDSPRFFLMNGKEYDQIRCGDISAKITFQLGLSGYDYINISCSDTCAISISDIVIDTESIDYKSESETKNFKKFSIKKGNIKERQTVTLSFLIDDCTYYEDYYINKFPHQRSVAPK